ncbi:MAG: hypothetical protein EOP48_33300 [Sphingobacteriales bacterium]|nr:MAG: hypothetical protein EOP48_33300 [Sphingobacteriales bacterium]
MEDVWRKNAISELDNAFKDLLNFPESPVEAYQYLADTAQDFRSQLVIDVNSKIRKPAPSVPLIVKSDKLVANLKRLGFDSTDQSPPSLRKEFYNLYAW